MDWLAKHSEIEAKDVIGKGPIGNYFRGTWKGKEVKKNIIICVMSFINMESKGGIEVFDKSKAQGRRPVQIDG